MVGKQEFFFHICKNLIVVTYASFTRYRWIPSQLTLGHRVKMEPSDSFVEFSQVNLFILISLAFLIGSCNEFLINDS